MHERQTAAYCMPSVHATILMHVFVVVEASKSHPVFLLVVPVPAGLWLSCSAHVPAAHTLYFLELENYLEFWQLRTNLRAHSGNPAKTLLSFQSLELRAFCFSWTSVFIFYSYVSPVSRSDSSPSPVFPLFPLIPNTQSTQVVCSSRMQQNSRQPFQSNLLKSFHPPVCCFSDMNRLVYQCRDSRKPRMRLCFSALKAALNLTLDVRFSPHRFTVRLISQRTEEIKSDKQKSHRLTCSGPGC